MKLIKIMRKHIFVILFALIGLCGSAQNNGQNVQITLPGTHVEFSLPQHEWKYLQTTNVDKNTTVYLYSYMARNVLDEKGDTIIPYLRIYVKKNYSSSVYDLTWERYQNQPFQSLDEFTEGIPNSGLGYIGAYNSPYDRKDYQFRMVYFKDRNTAFEFRAETSLDTYEEFDEMFTNILNSVTVKSK